MAPTCRRTTISKITDAILEEMNDWLARPLDRVYLAVFIDAIHVQVRDGQVQNRAYYTAIGVTVDGKRDILGIWPSSGGEGAKYWLGVLTELRNRGVFDECIVVCDGLKGLPDAVGDLILAALFELRISCVENLRTWNAIGELAEKFGGDRAAMWFGAPAPERL
jgi:transposase-like protein